MRKTIRTTGSTDNQNRQPRSAQPGDNPGPGILPPVPPASGEGHPRPERAPPGKPEPATLPPEPPPTMPPVQPSSAAR